MRIRIHSGILIGSLLLITPALQAMPERGGYPAIFGSREVPMPAGRQHAKWVDMNSRYSTHNRLRAPPCKQAGLELCRVRDWRAFLTTIKDLSRFEQLQQVNTYINRIKYVQDIVNYGVQDYWATPQEHITNSGDCEDFAIAKYFSLTALGVHEKDMRVLVVHDLNLNVAHAILTVYLDGILYALDNQITRVVPASIIFHYQPIYSVNAANWWFHIKSKS